jgi:3-hydroxy-3-methylglutaryl CoA synthase
MVGIVAFGGYVPFYRLNRKLIFQSVGWVNSATAAQARGEKAVANFDEDAVTMAAAAGMDCLKGTDPQSVGGIFLASTSLPYRERLNAGIVSSALNLSPQSQSADYSTSLKAGTAALLSALAGLTSEKARPLLVCAADCRLGRMGSTQEHIFGDGAAAFLIGREDPLAVFLDSYSLTYDFMDRWRSWDDKFDKTWEDRFIRDEGYTKIIPEAVTGFLAKTGLKPADFKKIIFPCPYDREHAAIAKKLGFAPEQVQDNMISVVGDTGAAYPLMMLAAALEEAQPGDKILVASYGNGSDVLGFEVTPSINKNKARKGIRGYLKQRAELAPYEKYTVYRNMIPQEVGIRGELENATPFSHLWRERKAIHGLVGSLCRKCQTPQFPPQRICVNPDCVAVDQMEDYPFAQRRGTVFTYTGDMLAFSVNPPAIYGMVDMEGGGRLFIDFTDCRLEELKVGMTMEMSFRRKYFDALRGIHEYFWKAVPVRD